LIELFLGAAIGAITFSGSVIAYGKLSGKYKFRLFQGAPVTFAGQHKLNLVLGRPAQRNIWPGDCVWLECAPGQWYLCCPNQACEC